jgi:hypothetical protein
MPVKVMDFYSLATKMMEGTAGLWYRIGERLLIGQERYGDYTFHTKDLDQMAMEELEDFIVYLVAKADQRKSATGGSP